MNKQRAISGVSKHRNLFLSPFSVRAQHMLAYRPSDTSLIIALKGDVTEYATIGKKSKNGYPWRRHWCVNQQVKSAEAQNPLFPVPIQNSSNLDLYKTINPIFR